MPFALIEFTLIRGVGRPTPSFVHVYDAIAFHTNSHKAFKSMHSERSVD